ncbi:MAG: hypothetical protein K9K78_07475, partial [Spirochaetales bacterium]|nr:hypothetical protein [Spirochaetales bacterium]
MLVSFTLKSYDLMGHEDTFNYGYKLLGGFSAGSDESVKEDLREKRKEIERELEEHNRDTRRFEITANSMSMQEVFFSKEEACRKLNIGERKLDECIEKGIPINWQGEKYLLQKQEASRTDIRDFNTKNSFYSRMKVWNGKRKQTRQ